MTVKSNNDMLYAVSKLQDSLPVLCVGIVKKSSFPQSVSNNQASGFSEFVKCSSQTQSQLIDPNGDIEKELGSYKNLQINSKTASPAKLTLKPSEKAEPGFFKVEATSGTTKKTISRNIPSLQSTVEVFYLSKETKDKK